MLRGGPQVSTTCGHWYCDACISEHMLTGNPNSNKCPMCRGAITNDSLRRPALPAAAAAGAEEAAEGAEVNAAGLAAAAVTFECRTKLHALVRLLREMREKDDSAKALVFSQVRHSDRTRFAFRDGTAVLVRMRIWCSSLARSCMRLERVVGFDFVGLTSRFQLCESINHRTAVCAGMS
jgi:hypothetical protein